MDKDRTKQLINDFYTHYNNTDLEKLFSLISDDFEHEINYQGIEKGKEAFIHFIKTCIKHYKEYIGNYTLMLSDDGLCGSTRFIVKGKYIATDDTQIPANGQEYRLEVYNYFEVKEGLFIKGKALFDDNDFKRQISS